MSIAFDTLSAASSGSSIPATDQDKLKATAKQFEALFLRQMLAAARKSDFGGSDLFGSQAMDTFNQMQDEHFADIAAQTGVLGFASLIEAQVSRFLPQQDTAAAGDPTAAASTAAASTDASAGDEGKGD